MNEINIRAFHKIDKQALQDQYEKTPSFDTMADIYGVNATTIKKKFYKLGIERTQEMLPWRYWAKQEGFESPCDVLYHYYYDERLQYKQIAEIFIKYVFDRKHITRNTIRMKMKRNGLVD